MSLLGDKVDGETAARIGLVNWLVEDDELETRTAQLAGRLAALSRGALIETKQLVRSGLDTDAAVQLEREAQAIGRCMSGPDFDMAITGLAGRRPSSFHGVRAGQR